MAARELTQELTILTIEHGKHTIDVYPRGTLYNVTTPALWQFCYTSLTHDDEPDPDGWSEEEIAALSEVCYTYFVGTAKQRHGYWKFTKVDAGYRAIYGKRITEVSQVDMLAIGKDTREISAHMAFVLGLPSPCETVEELAAKVSKQCQYWNTMQAAHDAFAW